jgi:crotonobetainyl-CoA:carnitine CoA-transferase CaiB-like acyl-CoA transferase
MSLPPPAVGENTREILAAMGYAEKDIAELRQKKVI